MGILIDTDRVEKNPRCSDVKEAVIWINLLCPAISFLILAYAIIKVYLRKKRLPFLTKIIFLICFFEIMNIISKMLQILKYAFRDTRRDFFGDDDKETPRGIICQAQIFISIFSDFGTLLSTLLLSYRSNEVIKSKKRRLDKTNVRILAIGGIFLISFLYATIFLLIDKSSLFFSRTYKYDLRDRCSYWCWLSHIPSIICYVFYFIILVLNIIFACKTKYYLDKSYSKLLQNSEILIDKSDRNDILNDGGGSSGGVEKNLVGSKEDKERMDQLQNIIIKFKVYPWITNIIWFVSTLYRVFDDIAMNEIDNSGERSDSENAEKRFYENNTLKILVEIGLVSHTFLSAFRGTLYGISFLIFEENVLWNKNYIFNFFYKFCCCCCKKKVNFEILEEHEIIEKEIMDNDDPDSRKSNVSDLSKNNNDMNISDYQYND